MAVRVLGLCGSLRAASYNHALVSKAAEKFNDRGELVDEATRKIVRDQLVAFEAWIVRLRGGQ